MKKIIIFVIMIFMLSGCNVNYNLNIENGLLKEEIDIDLPNALIDDDNLEEIDYDAYLLLYDEHFPLKNEEVIYKRSVERKDKTTTVNLEYTYDFSNFENSSILNSCFTNAIVLNQEKSLYIKLNGPYLCKRSDDTIKINVSTPYMVSIENSPRNNKNNYSWEINDENVDDIEIELMILKTLDTSNNTMTIIRIVTFIFLIICSIGIIVFYKKSIDK